MHAICYHLLLPCEAKKLHRFIFAIALSELHLLWQCLAHIYCTSIHFLLSVYCIFFI